ncbi:MAG: Ig-like domain-containing protein [Candidatus Methanomethylicia archaeon]
MESKRLLWIALLTLIFTAFLPSPYTLAAFQIKTDKDSYYPGSKVTFIISGATPNKKVLLELHDPSDNVKHVDEVTTDSAGSASASITIPSDWPLGKYTIYAKDSYTGQLVSYQFNIAAPPKVTTILITANTTSILAGKAVAFTTTVKDQYGNVMVGVDVDLIVDGIKYSTKTTDSSGSATFTVTFNTAGTYHVYAYSAGVSSDTVTITVAAIPPTLTSITLTANATSITQYQTVLFVAYALDQYGNGMAGITVDLYLDGSRIAYGSTDSTGRVTFTYTFNNPGSFSVRAVSGTISSSTITISVAAYVPPPRVTTVSLTIDRQKINVGESVSVTVTVKDQYGNVMANKKVELYINDVKQLERYTGTDGKVSFTTPMNIAGSYRIKAGCEGVFSTEVTVTVEAPPPPPVPTWSYSIIIPVVILVIILILLLILARRF